MLVTWSAFVLVVVFGGLGPCDASVDTPSSQVDSIVEILHTGFDGAAPQQAWEHSFALVTDLDHASKDSHKFQWHAVMKTGVLRRNATGAFSVEWLKETKLTTKIAVDNRGMELSEIVKFNGKLLVMCDKTGIVFEVLPSGKAVQRWAVSDGDGDEVKPYKFEWATVKDGELIMGSIGKDWVSDTGSILHKNPEWVKIMDASGRIRSENWGFGFDRLREVTNTTTPGYLWHEAVEWDPVHRVWAFLPRKENLKANNLVYNPEADETLGTNLLLMVSEDFRDVQVYRVGDWEPEFGFSAIRSDNGLFCAKFSDDSKVPDCLSPLYAEIPGTSDLYLALKIKEVTGDTQTKMVVINSKGSLVSDWIPVSELKFEGVEFL